MKKLWPILLLLLFLGTVVLCCFQWQALAQLRGENKTLLARLQKAQSDAESDYNKKFSLLDADANLLRNQVKELPKLRSQIQSLRNATNEITKLLAENQKLKASQPPSATNVTIKPISYVMSTNASSAVLVPKESWVFSGYSTPEAALQSSVWAASQGNMKELLNSFSPELREQLSKEIEAKPEKFAEDTQNEFTKVAGYRIEEHEQTSTNEVKLKVNMESNSKSTTFIGSKTMIMRKSGGEWKLAVTSD